MTVNEDLPAGIRAVGLGEGLTGHPGAHVSSSAPEPGASGLAPEAEAPAASKELERPKEILNPVTGALIAVNDLEAVGTNILMLRNVKAELERVVAELSAAAAEESKRQGTRTLTAGPVRLVVSADTEIAWDIAALRERLTDAGCPPERLGKLIKVTVEEKVDAAVARQLAGANPHYAAIVEACQSRVPKRSYVKVEDTDA